jgi:hypothetical protein
VLEIGIWVAAVVVAAEVAAGVVVVFEAMRLGGDRGRGVGGGQQAGGGMALEGGR